MVGWNRRYIDDGWALGTRLSVWLQQLAPCSAKLLGVTLARLDRAMQAPTPSEDARSAPSGQRPRRSLQAASRRAGCHVPATLILSFGAFNTATSCRHRVRGANHLAAAAEKSANTRRSVGRSTRPARRHLSALQAVSTPSVVSSHVPPFGSLLIQTREV